MLAKYMLKLNTASTAAAHSSHQEPYDSCRTDKLNGRPAQHSTAVNMQA